MGQEGTCLPSQLVLVLLHHGRGHIGNHHLHIQLIDHGHLGKVATEELKWP